MDLPRIILGAALLAGTVSAIAQSPQPARPVQPVRLVAQEHAAIAHPLARLVDTNHDGQLSEEEKRAFRSSHPRPDPRGVPVAKLDLNGDGFISREEQEAFRQARQEHRQEHVQRREDRREERVDRSQERDHQHR